jgi:hypothetical protein
LLVTFLSAALLASEAASAITPQTVERMIERYGPKRSLKKLANAVPDNTRSDFGDYDKVLDGIASGAPRWLALVPKLQPGTDAGTAEALRIAVAKALPKNPSGVLSLITRQPSWRDACTYPMIEPTNKEERAYFRVVLPAVRAVRSPALRRARSICLAELNKAQHSS